MNKEMRAPSMNNEMVFQDITKQVSVMDHISDVRELCVLLQPFHAARESTYRMSFAKRGEVGIWMNLARKYDRIDGLMEQIGKTKIQSVYITLIDTLVDLALYSLKWLAIIRRFEPESFSIWMDKNGIVEKKQEDIFEDDGEYLGSLESLLRDEHGKIVGVISDRPIENLRTPKGYIRMPDNTLRIKTSD